MRLETEKKICYVMIYTIFPLIIYTYIKLYIDGDIPLIVMILIIIIALSIFIFVITYTSKYFKKKIKHRKATRFHIIR